MKTIKGRGGYKKKYDPLDRYERNDWIKASELLVIDQNGENLGKISKQKALEMARKDGLDLVVISKDKDSTVAKIVDWSKFKYLQSKKRKKQAKSVNIKEWWFSQDIEDHDIENKLRRAKSNVEKYLAKGGKAKLTVKFKRKSDYNTMRQTIERIRDKAEEFSEIVGDINKEGKNLSIYLKPKKGKNEKQTENTQSDSEEI